MSNTDHTLKSADLLAGSSLENTTDDMESALSFLEGRTPAPSDLGGLAAREALPAEMSGTQAIDAFMNPKKEESGPTEREILEAAMESLDMSPAAVYKRNLEEAGVSWEEAMHIIDRVVVSLKPYSEKFKISDTVYVEFRTRTQADQHRLNQSFEKDRPQYRPSIELEIAKHHIASSLLRYGNTSFDHSRPDHVESTLAWLNAIPQPVFLLIQQRLFQFDAKIGAVFSEGYIENFWPTHS